jgi:hypothetical protein
VALGSAARLTLLSAGTTARLRVEEFETIPGRPGMDAGELSRCVMFADLVGLAR